MPTRRALTFGLAALGLLHPSRLFAQAFDPAKIESAQRSSELDPRAGGFGAEIARLQIMLDRAVFSPGLIDGHGGDNTANALAAFRAHHDLGDGDGLNDEVWSALDDASDGSLLQEYEITKKDVDGPFLDAVPEKLEEQAKLDHLGYTSVVELLSEKFHISEELLRALNAEADFRRAGARITVPSVKRDRSEKASFVKVDTTGQSVRAFSADEELLGYYPATVGSESRPAPKGTFKIQKVAENPLYTYDPRRLSFEGVKADKPFNIAPGPNNPVGSVWIEINDDGYAIHGTPDPALISKSFSHGCIRLTNWDALHLAHMVEKNADVTIS